MARRASTLIAVARLATFFLDHRSPTMTDVRTGQAPDKLWRDRFGERFRSHSFDSAFDAERIASAVRAQGCAGAC